MALLAMYYSSYVTHGGVCPKVQAQHMSMVACLHDFPIKLHTWRVINWITQINIYGFAFKLSLNFVKETISQEGMSQPTLSNCPCLLESGDAHITSNINIYYIYMSSLAFQLRKVCLWEGCSTLLPKPTVQLWDRVLQDALFFLKWKGQTGNPRTEIWVFPRRFCSVF